MTMLLQKPQLVVRVGITGHRKLGDDPQVQQAISAALIRVFETLQSQVNILHQTDQGQGDLSLYDDKLPTLRLISGLAAGADQLAAHAALNQGWQLEAVLPFTVDEFRKDFGTPAEPTRFGEAFGLPGGDDLAAFEALLAKAGPACIELCGPAKPAELRNRSYLAVGQGIVRRCEVLVAVWDGCEAAGKGGSADVVEHALRNHVPVIWIPTEGQNQSFWLDSTEDYYAVLLDRRDSLSPLTDDTLCRYLKHQLLVEFNEKKKPGLYDQPYTLAQFREDIDRHCQNPVCKPVFGYGFFRKLRDWISGPVPGSGKNEDNQSGLLDRYFLERYKPIDDCAFAYSDGYRSTYTAIFLLGALAITAAILGAAGVHAAVWIELPILVVVFALFHFEHVPDRHGRWIACRLLAELLRQSRWLSLLGIELTLGRNEMKHEERRPKEGWLLVCLQAMIRAAPSQPLRLDSVSLDLLRNRVRDVLLYEQIDYHHVNAHRSGRVAKRLGLAAVGLFLLTFGVVAAEFVLSFCHFGPDWLAGVLSILAGVIPTFVAATAAFRQQSEFELLENTSELMHAALVHADQRLEALDCTQPWAAELLGEELVRIADLMTSDVADWSLVFKVKAVETA